MDGFQLSVLAYKYLGPQYFNEAHDVDKAKVGCYMLFICENN